MAIQPQPRVIVSQHGARHRYAIPRLLNEAGLLERFYTDTSAHSPLGNVAKILVRLFPLERLKGKLLERTVEGVPPAKVYSSDAVLSSDLLRVLSPPAHPFMAYRRRHKVLSREMMKWGTGEASWVYVMYDEGCDWLQYAKARGLRCAVDVFIHPGTARILLEEERQFPELAVTSISPALVEERESYLAESLRLADLLTCPSEWVAKGVTDLVPEVSDRVRIVPYGSSLESPVDSAKCVQGRILFVGNAVLRKGLHYLGMAASSLRSSGRHYDFRIGGSFPATAIQHPLCKNLRFLGKLSSRQLLSEFATADVFVLPTLSEGFPSVLAEAMCAGLPVITTSCAGSQITSGQDGLLVPPRDHERLAQAIDCVIKDRHLRSRLADAALTFAKQHYCFEAWKCRLCETFQHAQTKSEPKSYSL